MVPYAKIRRRRGPTSAGWTWSGNVVLPVGRWTCRHKHHLTLQEAVCCAEQHQARWLRLHDEGC